MSGLNSNTSALLLQKSTKAPIWQLMIVCALAAFNPCAFAAQPWDVAFAKDTRMIADAARRVIAPDDQSVVVLLEDHRYVIDREGRTSSTVRKVYRILKEDAVEDWASVEQAYQPWYEQSPQIRARVITSDGVTHWLDPKTIADSPAHEFDSTIFSDRRVLRAPLPAVSTGSVVEYEISVHEKLPLLESGVTRRVTVMDSVKLERFHLLIEAEKSIELRTLARLVPEVAIRRRATTTGTQIECELGPFDVRKDFEFSLPADTPSYPHISFSTGKSWQAIAARYENIVDQQIKASDLRPMLEGIDLKGSPLAVAARLTAQLHKEIRYTGVEFGEAAIVPRTPGETLQRKYGDCKDKSALLVAMLRAAGLNAYVALLASGFGTDVDETLPGLGLFDHAIVHVASEPPLWIDPRCCAGPVSHAPLWRWILYQLFLHDGKLFLRLKNNPDAEAVPVLNDLFRVDGKDLSFSRNAQKQITGFVLSSGRIRNLRFVREGID